MRTITLKNINNFIIISDVHLQNPNDKLTTLFIRALDDILKEQINGTNKIEAIFLLGDIFDFITVSKNFFLDLWKIVFNKFFELKSNNISLYFIEGNHDFGFEHFHSKNLDKYFTEYGDFIVEFKHNIMGNIVLRHGDNLVCSPKYHKPRAFFKSYLFQKIANIMFSGRLMHYICLRYAKKSRHNGEYNTLAPTFLTKCITEYLNDYQNTFKKSIDTLIIGHIHLNVNNMYNKTHFLSGPDWFTAPNYLICNNEGKINRIFLK